MAEERLVCTWCNAQNEIGQTSCSRCGAPLSVEDKVTEAGWRAAPRVRDSTSFRFGNSTCEVEGEIVPSVQITLGGGDWIYFEATTLLWKEGSADWKDDGSKRSGGDGSLRNRRNPLMTVDGPATLALARESAGELVVLPVDDDTEIDVRQDAFIAASHSLRYTWKRLKGVGSILHGGSMSIEQFTAKGEDGLLMLHGSGNVFQRNLGPGETICVEPGGFLYKDSSVKADKFEVSGFKAHKLGGSVNLMKLTGPGRVGIQSMYHHHDDDEDGEE
jgi:uncharacterized protein (AIM24 family)